MHSSSAFLFLFPFLKRRPSRSTFPMRTKGTTHERTSRRRRHRPRRPRLGGGQGDGCAPALLSAPSALEQVLDRAFRLSDRQQKYSRTLGRHSSKHRFPITQTTPHTTWPGSKPHFQYWRSFCGRASSREEGGMELHGLEAAFSKWLHANGKEFGATQPFSNLILNGTWLILL